MASLWARQPDLGDGWRALTSAVWSTQPFTGAQASVGRELGRALEDVLAHRAPPDEALARAVARADRHLADYATDPNDYARQLREN